MVFPLFFVCFREKRENTSDVLRQKLQNSIIKSTNIRHHTR